MENKSKIYLLKSPNYGNKQKSILKDISIITGAKIINKIASLNDLGNILQIKIDEKTTNIRVRSRAALPEFEEDELKRYAVSGIFLAYYKQIEDLMEEYYDYLDVSVQDRPYDL
jgi:hypothetical protein